MRIKPFKALYPDMKMVPSADSFFGVMKKEFPNYLKNSFFKRTNTPSFFLYEVNQKNLLATGLIVSTSVEDIYDNKILKHEKTIALKEQKMLDLALQRNAMIKPVLLAHVVDPALAELYSKIKKREPFLNIKFKEEKSTHKIWRISDEAMILDIQRLFKNDISEAYIADGHHRVSTGILLNNSRKNSKAIFGDLLSIYFSFDELRIYDFNRVVSILKEISSTNLMAKLSKYFSIKPIKSIRKSKSKYEIIFTINQEVYQLIWKNKYRKSFSEDNIILDARLLNRFVFKEIMGIQDVRNDGRILYVGGGNSIKSIQKEMIKNDYAVGFLLYPVMKDELVQIADLGMSLPPKSTWFEPRIKNAVISQQFE